MAVNVLEYAQYVVSTLDRLSGEMSPGDRAALLQMVSDQVSKRLDLARELAATTERERIAEGREPCF